MAVCTPRANFFLSWDFAFHFEDTFLTQSTYFSCDPKTRHTFTTWQYSYVYGEARQKKILNICFDVFLSNMKRFLTQYCRWRPLRIQTNLGESYSPKNLPWVRGVQRRSLFGICLVSVLDQFFPRVLNLFLCMRESLSVHLQNKPYCFEILICGYFQLLFCCAHKIFWLEWHFPSSDSTWRLTE